MKRTASILCLIALATAGALSLHSTPFFVVKNTSGSAVESCIISTNNTAAYYRLDEAATPSVDASGITGDLTWTGTPTSYSGKITNALGFDNTKTQFLAGATSGLLTISNVDVTITAWCYLSNKTTTQTIVSKDTLTTSQNGYVLDYDQTVDRFRFRLGGTNGMAVPSIVSVISTNGGSPSSNTWYFVTAQFCRASNYIAISVNNSGLDKATYAATIAPQNNSSTFKIAAQQYHLPPNTSARWIGMIDEVFVVHGRLLPLDEVTCLYHAGSPGKNQTWPFTL